MHEFASGAAARLARSHGHAHIAFKRRGPETALADLFQSGCARVRLPGRNCRERREAVLINTAGGLTGGDRLTCEAAWAEGTRATVTSQAAERIYRASHGVALVRTHLAVAPGARAAWLPQETILFDGARLDRATDVELVGDGSLLACESLVAGRTSMGETVRDCRIEDAWRVRIDGRLVFADTFRHDGDLAAALGRAAVGGGACAFATVIVVGPAAAAALETLRNTAAQCGHGELRFAASRRGPVTVARLLGATGAAMRAGLVTALEGLLSAGIAGAGPALPRVWLC